MSRSINASRVSRTAVAIGLGWAAVLWVFPWFLSGSSGDQPPAPVVSEIRMEIDGQPGSEDMLNLLPVREGEAFSLSKISQSIRQIYKSGLFADVRVLKEGDERIRLTYVLTRKLYTRRIQFVVPEGIELKKLREGLEAIQVDAPYTGSARERAVEEIQALLAREGFFQPDIQVLVERVPGTAQVDVSFMIRSAKQYTVSKIVFEGDLVLPEGEVRKRLQIREGDVFVPEVLDEDIRNLKALYESMDYRRAEVRLRDTAFDDASEQVALTIEVLPQEKIEIVVEGAKVPLELIRPIWEAPIFEEWGLAEGEAKIIRHLRKKGYLFASVDSEIHQEGNRLRILHRVVRGRRFRIKEVAFEGLEHFTPSEIKKALLVGQGFSLFKRIDGARLFELPRDIEFFYKTRGFPKARASLSFLREDTKLKPVLFVQEGEQERIESISFPGASLADEPTLLAQISSTPGGPFYQPNIQKDVEKLEDFYLNQGVRGTEVQAQVQRSGEGLYRVAFLIKEGHSVRVGRIIITGNRVTRRSTIEREIALKEGDLARLEAIRETKRRLERLGIFSEVKIEEVPVSKTQENLLISVREGSRNYASLGLGIETRNEPRTFAVWNNVIRPRGTAEFIRNNIFGLAAQVSLVGQISFREKRGVFSWEQPQFFGLPLETYLNAWLEREARKSFTYDRRGLSLTGIKTLSGKENMLLLTTLRFARTIIVELNIAESEIDRRFFPFSTTSISWSYIWEMRDDPFNPTRGFFLSSAFEWAYPYLKAESEFLKSFTKFQGILPVIPGLTFRSTVRVGLGKGRIPIHERFFAGGSNSFRGVEFDELGPKDPESGRPVGGKALVLFNFELTFPLFSSLKDLSGVVFYDKGNIFSKRRQVSLASLQDALGLGIRYRTPLGPVRLELGWNLDAPRGERNILGFITIGNVF
ncbi:MAG: POTRA domain-containing protein [Candidatus Aminicenantales bacterium]